MGDHPGRSLRYLGGVDIHNRLLESPSPQPLSLQGEGLLGSRFSSWICDMLRAFKHVKTVDYH